MRGILSLGYIITGLFKEKLRRKNAEIEVAHREAMEQERKKQEIVTAQKTYYDRYADQYKTKQTAASESEKTLQ